LVGVSCWNAWLPGDRALGSVGSRLGTTQMQLAHWISKHSITTSSNFITTSLSRSPEPSHCPRIHTLLSFIACLFYLCLVSIIQFHIAFSALPSAYLFHRLRGKVRLVAAGSALYTHPSLCQVAVLTQLAGFAYLR
jgi:hypothetical protein